MEKLKGGGEGQIITPSFQLENYFGQPRIIQIYIFQTGQKPSIKKITGLKNRPQLKDKNSMRELLRDIICLYFFIIYYLCLIDLLFTILSS